MNHKLALFEEKQIRKVWKDEKWYFSVVDVIFALTDSVNPRDYWYKLKKGQTKKKRLSCRQFVDN